MNNRLVAQQSPAEKKSTPNTSDSKTGFKRQSPAPFTEKRSAPKDPAPVSTDIHKTEVKQNVLSPAEKENAAKASEAIRIDYNNMPADVQSKINTNKTQGKYLLEGIAKTFLVEIKTCSTDTDRKKTLSFLKNKKGFINSQFVSAGLVKIIVEPTFDIDDLKDAMVAEGIHFNFLKRSYLLKK
jgi:hypothetical protein